MNQYDEMAVKSALAWGVVILSVWLFGCDRAVQAVSEDSYNIHSCRVLVRRIGRDVFKMYSCPMERGDLCYFYGSRPMGCTNAGVSLPIPRGDEDE